MMAKALNEIFAQSGENLHSAEYEHIFTSNRQQLIETMLTSCTECQNEQNLSGGAEDEYKLSFDKSTGTRKRSLESI